LVHEAVAQNWIERVPNDREDRLLVVLFAAAILDSESPGFTVTVVDPVAPAVVPDAAPAVVVPAPDPVRLSRSLSNSPLAASSEALIPATSACPCCTPCW
jgi:hypothetical protein